MGKKNTKKGLSTLEAAEYLGIQRGRLDYHRRVGNIAILSGTGYPDDPFMFAKADLIELRKLLRK